MPRQYSTNPAAIRERMRRLNENIFSKSKSLADNFDKSYCKIFNLEKANFKAKINKVKNL
ncbi:hypothetical protein BLA29_014501 [Euroglyphus maynei]|uniref:Uncharacterized protein n=1 Tax=Euroglyphus maynei TaxID=6958 RepID=A0A1Y3BHP0_EURMA|nr:hypothetical protein BLA29_014501 [Euroglyphus maynei]